MHLWFQGDDIASGNSKAWSINFLAVHQDVAMDDHLSCCPDRANESCTTKHVVESLLKKFEKHFTGVATKSTRFCDVQSELLLKNVVVVSQLSREDVKSTHIEETIKLEEDETYHLVVDHTGAGEAQPDWGDDVWFRVVLTLERA